MDHSSAPVKVPSIVSEVSSRVVGATGIGHQFTPQQLKTQVLASVVIWTSKYVFQLLHFRETCWDNLRGWSANLAQLCSMWKSISPEYPETASPSPPYGGCKMPHKDIPRAPEPFCSCILRREINKGQTEQAKCS